MINTIIFFVFHVFTMAGFMFGAVACFVVLKLIIPNLFPYRVLTFEKRKNGLFPVLDRAKIIMKDGIERLQLLKSRQKIAVTPYEDINIMRGQGFGLITLYSRDRHHYAPIKFNESAGKLETISRDQRYFSVLDSRADARTWGSMSTLQRLLPVIMIGTVLLFTIMIMIFGWQNLVAVMGQGAGQLTANTESNFALTDSINRLLAGGGFSGSTPPPP